MNDWQLALFLVAALALTAYRIVKMYKANQRLYTPEVRAALELAKRTDKLRETDPAAADRLLRDGAKQLVRQEEQVRMELRRRAPSDPAAAADLKFRLLEDLDSIAISQRHIEKEFRDDPKRLHLLAEAKEAKAKAERELAELEKLVGRGQP